MIAVIDYGMGNLRSVSKALERVGAEVRVTPDPAVVAAADAVVLPGVGAFARCMDNLCTEPTAWECNQAGKVCRYGDCVVECNNNADCQAKGYPAYYQCQQSRCEHDV